MGHKTKMKSILVIGSNGMLGHQVFKFLNDLKIFKVDGTSRKKKKNLIRFDINKDNILKFKKYNYIINCSGIIKPRIKKSVLDAIKVNSIFPHKLSDFSKKNHIKMIHITTDCVFSGDQGMYDENSMHDALDAYGKSKSLGEPSDCLTIRTSIIGLERDNRYSLVEWLKKNKNKNVFGFYDHLWNGVTTKYLAFILSEIIRKKKYKKGLYHLAMNEKINKYNLLKLINNKLDLNVKINKKKSSKKIDRTLKTKHKYFNSYKNMSYEKMIDRFLV